MGLKQSVEDRFYLNFGRNQCADSGDLVKTFVTLILGFRRLFCQRSEYPLTMPGAGEQR